MKNATKFDLTNLRISNPFHYHIKDGFDNCFLCNKPVKIDSSTNWIHINTDIEAIDRFNETDDSQGCFPIGSDCAHKLPKNLVFKY